MLVFPLAVPLSDADALKLFSEVTVAVNPIALLRFGPTVVLTHVLAAVERG